MNVGLKVAGFFGEIALIGFFLYLFNEVTGLIMPNFIIYHTAAYAIGAFVVAAIPAIALFGLILKYARKEKPPTRTIKKVESQFDLIVLCVP